MNYEEMSDFEINEAVILTLFDGSENPIVTKAFPNAGDSLAIASAARVKFYDDSITTIDFCKNPSDAQSIILDTCMTIELAHPELGGFGTNTIYNPRGTDWQCDYEDNKQWLRAAMICFLKMKESENG